VNMGRPKKTELHPLEKRVLEVIVFGHRNGHPMRTISMSLGLKAPLDDVRKAVKELHRLGLVETTYLKSWSWKPTQKGLLFHRGEVTL
jgi:Mn-dependent DtxR family transcriptional regulator